MLSHGPTLVPCNRRFENYKQKVLGIPQYIKNFALVELELLITLATDPCFLIIITHKIEKQ